MSMLQKLDDKFLVECYDYAVRLNLDYEFVCLLEKEIRRRSLAITDKNESAQNL